jgi:hypothetical protein
MTYKFDGKRYMTKRIQTEIPSDLQTVMWLLIDENVKKGLKMYYLQVFNLAPFYQNGILCQKLFHTQEVPRHNKELTLNVVEKAVKAKIYVIDDVEHITMLLADEY